MGGKGPKSLSVRGRADLKVSTRPETPWRRSCVRHTHIILVRSDFKKFVYDKDLKLNR